MLDVLIVLRSRAQFKAPLSFRVCLYLYVNIQISMYP